MNAPAPIEALPVMIRNASEALLSATTSAEVLEARDLAAVAYDAAKTAKRLLKVKSAHDDVIASVYRAQGQALQIEARAKIRLADEYDAAQGRGEVGQKTGRPKVVSDGNDILTAADIGLTRKQIHEARQIRDAERANPGMVDKLIDDTAEDGREPTRASLKAAVSQKPAQVNPGTSNKQFYAIVKAWEGAGPAARERFYAYLEAHGEAA